MKDIGWQRANARATHSYEQQRYKDREFNARATHSYAQQRQKDREFNCRYLIVIGQAPLGIL